MKENNIYEMYNIKLIYFFRLNYFFFTPKRIRKIYIIFILIHSFLLLAPKHGVKL